MVCIFAAMSLIPSLQKAFWFGIASAAIFILHFMIRDYVELLKLRNQHPKLDTLVPAKQNPNTPLVLHDLSFR